MSMLKLLVHYQIKNGVVYFYKNNKNVYVAFAEQKDPEGNNIIIDMGEYGTKKTEVINNFKNAYDYNKKFNYKFIGLK